MPLRLMPGKVAIARLQVEMYEEPTPLGYDVARLSPHPSTSGNFNAQNNLAVHSMFVQSPVRNEVADGD